MNAMHAYLVFFVPLAFAIIRCIYCERAYSDCDVLAASFEIYCVVVVMCRMRMLRCYFLRNYVSVLCTHAYASMLLISFERVVAEIHRSHC